MSAKSDNPAIVRGFRGSYCPGGQSSRAKRRELARRNGRRGGLASGKRRRALARGRRPARRRTRQTALALQYKQHQLTRKEFARRYREIRPTGNERGLETAWTEYMSLFTAYRCQGQHYRTTNGQRAIALFRRGRPRCRRQIQRVHRLLEEMGVAKISHYKDQRDRPGHKDCLVVEMRRPPSRSSKNVTPPLRGSGNPPHGREVPTTQPEKNEETPSGNDLSPPPSAADEAGAHSGAPDQSPREAELEAAIRFTQMKLEIGFCPGPARHELQRLQGELRRLRAMEPSASDPASPPDRSRGDSEP